MALSNSHTRTIEVPLQEEQVLEVDCAELPQDPAELTSIFQSEGCALLYYRLLAVSSGRNLVLDAHDILAS